MAFCKKCGAQLAPDAQFCPRCGTAVAAAAPAVPPPAAASPAAASPVTPTIPARVERKRGAWWIVPLVIVGLVIIAWLLLAGLPFGREGDRRADTPAVETIAEGTAPPADPARTGTIVDVTEDPQDAVPPMNTATTPITTEPLTTTTAAPAPARPAPTTTAPMPRQAEPEPVGVPAKPPVTRPQPAPAPVRTPVRTPAPTPVRTPTPAPAASGEISEDEASNVLRGFITSRNYYEGVSPGCVQLRGSGYRNVGYGFSVWDSCAGGGGSRMLGRWRVDSKTREVFRQRDDGRYLRP